MRLSNHIKISSYALRDFIGPRDVSYLVAGGTFFEICINPLVKHMAVWAAVHLFMFQPELHKQALHFICGSRECVGGG